MNKMSTYTRKYETKSNERLSNVEDKSESVDFAMGLVIDEMVQLETRSCISNHSPCNNLIVGNIPEALPGVNEDCESKIREFVHEHMKIAKDLVDKRVFERVHRMGPRASGK